MLMRFDPFRDFDRFFEQVAGRPAQAIAMPMDAYRHGDTIVVHFDLPGVDPGSIDLQVERNTLTVRAERHWQPVEGDDVIAAERRHAEFRRQLLLGDSIDTEQVHATYEDGVLTLTLPIREKAKPRRIEVTKAGDEKVLNAKSTETATTAPATRSRSGSR